VGPVTIAAHPRAVKNLGATPCVTGRAPVRRRRGGARATLKGVADDVPVRPGTRGATLLRHLAETAEREAAARGRLASALTRLLDTPAGGDLQPILAAVVASCPAIDACGVVAREGGGWSLLASLGLPHAPGPLAQATAADAPIAEAASSRRPAVASLRGGERSALLPPATRAVCAVPLLVARTPGEVVGVALFASRSSDGFDDDELLLARVAADRAARALETAQLAAALARAQETAGRTEGFRDQVLAIVGHDLRNPLGAIVMSAALLQKKGGLEGWQSKTVDRVRSSALRMGRIINDLLSYTRTRLGAGIPIDRRAADLGELTRKMVDELRTAHPDAVVEVSAEGDLSGAWDPDRLEQVLSNVVSNAIDHGQDGQPVAVRLVGHLDAVTIEVMNRGEMPRESLEHAFEAFHRGPEKTGKKASGLGLGLYIAREIVRHHGGEIAIRSQGGETRIELHLPRGPGPEAGPRAGA
jgi:signal transduction histidine kinase